MRVNYRELQIICVLVLFSSVVRICPDANAKYAGMDHDQEAKKVDPKPITIEEAKNALKVLVEDESFLKEYPSYSPLKEFLQKENKDTPITKEKVIIESIRWWVGRWSLHPKESTFGVSVVFPGNQFFAVSGKFVVDTHKGWTATITSTTRGHFNPGPGK